MDPHRDHNKEGQVTSNTLHPQPTTQRGHPQHVTHPRVHDADVPGGMTTLIEVDRARAVEPPTKANKQSP